MRRDRPPARSRSVLAALVLAATAALAACGQQQALGKANTVIIVTSDRGLWEEVRDTTYAVLEPRVFTVRREKKFYVQTVDTADREDYLQLRTFRQVAVFGTPDDPVVSEVVDAAGDEAPDPPALVHANDVWARNQSVTAVLLDPAAPAESWRSQLDDLAAHVDRRYRRWTRSRMYVTGPDTAAMDSLGDRFGFGLAFPRVYDVAVRGGGEGPVIVRNDNPSPADLIRSILVDWRSPPLDSLDAGTAYGWRAAVDSVHYGVPQAIDTTRRRTRRLEVNGRPALEVSGTWSDEEGDYPAGGPFLARLVQCPERTYFLDAWIYAPGEDKYQYLIQVRQILDSFTCGPPPPVPEAARRDGG